MKTTVLVWNYDNYFPLTTPSDSDPEIIANGRSEMNAKIAEMIENNEMLVEADMPPSSRSGVPLQVKTDFTRTPRKIITYKYFTNILSAEEWVDFNIEFATKYNLELISHQIV
jgi:hypothetical protein